MIVRKSQRHAGGVWYVEVENPGVSADPARVVWMARAEVEADAVRRFLSANPCIALFAWQQDGVGRDITPEAVEAISKVPA